MSRQRYCGFDYNGHLHVPECYVDPATPRPTAADADTSEPLTLALRQALALAEWRGRDNDDLATAYNILSEAISKAIATLDAARAVPEPSGLDVGRVHAITCGRLVDHEPGSDKPYLWPCTKFAREYAALSTERSDEGMG